MSLITIPPRINFTASLTHTLTSTPTLKDAAQIIQNLLVQAKDTGSTVSSDTSASSTPVVVPSTNISRDIIVFSELYISTLTAAKAMNIHSGKIATILNITQELIQQCQNQQWPDDISVVNKLWDNIISEQTNTSLPYRGSGITASSSLLSVPSTTTQPHDTTTNNNNILSPPELSIGSLPSMSPIDEHQSLANPHQSMETTTIPTKDENTIAITDTNTTTPVIPELEKIRSGEARSITEYFQNFGFLRHYYFYKYICTVPLPKQVVRMIVPIDTPLLSLPLSDATLEKEIPVSDGHDIPLKASEDGITA